LPALPIFFHFEDPNLIVLSLAHGICTPKVTDVALENREKLAWRTGSVLFPAKNAGAYIFASRQKPLNINRTQLKNVFWPNIFVGASFQILNIQQYASGLKIGPAAILNQNPIFEMGSKKINEPVYGNDFSP
jgi:hypothetical protein